MYQDEKTTHGAENNMTGAYSRRGITAMSDFYVGPMPAVTVGTPDRTVFRSIRSEACTS